MACGCGDGVPDGTKAAAQVVVSCLRVPDAQPRSEAEKMDLKRKMNVIHSRLKRERKFVRMDRLQEECREIEESNRHFEEDNIRLEKLLVEAKNVIVHYEYQN